MERAQAQEIVYREELWQPASGGYNSSPTTSGQEFYSHHGRSRTMPTFELVVPMSCATSEEQVRAALFDLEGVVDVVIDSYNQRVVVTGYVDPTQALMQVRLVNRNAAMWSEPSTSSTGNSYEDDGYVYHADRTYNRTFTREPSKRGYVTTSSGGSSQYFTTKCPGYTTSVSNCYIIPNPDNNVECRRFVSEIYG